MNTHSPTPNTQPANSYQVGSTQHYKEMPVQPWSVMESVLSPAEFRGFLKGNVIKYSMRAGHKPGSTDDAAKARHYQHKLDEYNAARSALYAAQKGTAE